MDVTKLSNKELIDRVQMICGTPESLRELVRRFEEQQTLTLKVDATAALEAIGDTAAQLAKIATERQAVLDEVIDELEARRKGGFWAIGDATGNHIRDQSFIRAIGAVKELKAKGE